MRARHFLLLSAWLAVTASTAAGLGCARTKERGNAASAVDTAGVDTSMHAAGSTSGGVARSDRTGSAPASSVGAASGADVQPAPADSAAVAAREAASTSGPGYAVTPAGSSAEIWRQIDAEVGKLESAVTARSSDLVHRYAYSIQSLFASLPGRSTDLSAASRTRVKQMAATVASEVSALDRAAHTGDVAGTRAALSRLKSTLASARALYPS